MGYILKGLGEYRQGHPYTVTIASHTRPVHRYITVWADSPTDAMDKASKAYSDTHTIIRADVLDIDPRSFEKWEGDDE